MKGCYHTMWVLLWITLQWFACNVHGLTESSPQRDFTIIYIGIGVGVGIGSFLAITVAIILCCCRHADGKVSQIPSSSVQQQTEIEVDSKSLPVRQKVATVQRVPVVRKVSIPKVKVSIPKVKVSVPLAKVPIRKKVPVLVNLEEVEDEYSDSD